MCATPQVREDAFKDRLAQALDRDPRYDREIAKAAGLSPGDVSRMRNGKQDPTQTSLAALVRALRVSGHWLLTGEGSMHPDPETDAVKLEVIGMVCDEEVDALALRQFAEAARGAKRDDAGAQVRTAAPVRGGGSRPPEPGENDGSDETDPPEDPAKEGTNGPPNTKRRAGP